LVDVWRLLISKETDPYLNMAVEEALLEAVEREEVPNTLRLWRSSCSAVVGLSEKVEETVNLENCRQLQIPVLRRFTGGGTVYVDLGNLNWTFVFRKEREGQMMSSLSIFEKYSAPIVKALEDFGVKAKFKPPNALFIGLNKISGMAIYVKRRSVLCHGTLLINADLNLLKLALKRLKDPVANLVDESPQKPSVEEVMKLILEASEKTLNIKLVEEELSPSEKELTRVNLYNVYEPMRLTNTIEK